MISIIIIICIRFRDSAKKMQPFKTKMLTYLIFFIVFKKIGLKIDLGFDIFMCKNN